MEANTSTVSKRRTHYKFILKEVYFIRKWTVDAPEGMRKSARELATFPDMKWHTQESIAGVIKRYGFARPSQINRMKLSKKLGKDKKELIVDFLRGQGRFWPNSIVAEHFNQSQEKIKRLRSINKLALVHGEESLKDPVYKKWYEQKEANRISFLKKAFILRPSILLHGLEEKKLRFQVNGYKDRKTRVCRFCKHRWPLTSDFFRQVKRISTKGKKYSVFTRGCCACPVRSKKRNQKLSKKLEG